MSIYSQRIKELQRLLKKEKLDAVVINRPIEAGFLTGFYLDGCVLLISKTNAWAFVPKMLFEHFKYKVPFVEAVASNDIKAGVIAEIKKYKFKIKKTVFQPETETYVSGMFWKKHGLIEKAGLTACLRLTKKGAELKAIRKACHVAAKAFLVIKSRIKAGRTEISVARELEDIMQAMGATGPSFDLIVAFGANSALPHHETSMRVLKKNEAVLIDYGCIYDFYRSDMTRTFFYGKADTEFKKVYSIVETSQKKAVKALKSGIKAAFIDKTARDLIMDEGYGQYFVHGTGHGVGLEIHEAPTVNSKSKDILKEGMILTVEPGIYLNGKFGVRIEDTLLVKKNGCEILTK
ncbi:MAG: aminopeptidase P family protein [Elusimicrobia bacterium]|nr:aminopeptidase P family protein [Elusimicrobiota bacterium]